MIRQYGVLAYDIAEDGEPRFLLITSRKTRRWVIPRGNPIPGLSPAQSAAQEAFEEAGVTGIVSPDEIGAYRYEKRRRSAAAVLANVHVFPLRTTAQSDRWPERRQRDTRWFTRQEAAAAVDEPGLKELILAFSPPLAPVGFPFLPHRHRRLLGGFRSWKPSAWAITLPAAALIGAAFYALASLLG